MNLNLLEVFLEGNSFERYYSHEIIENLFSRKSPTKIQLSFEQYFDHVFLKRGKAFNYDKRLEKLMYKLELDWIRQELPIAFKEGCEISSKIQKEIENDPMVLEYEFAA